LVTKSPQHAWLQHPRFGGKRNVDTKTTDSGTLIHQLLLDAGRGVEVIDAEDFKTKVARGARDAARGNGKTPVLQADYAQALLDVKEIRTGLNAAGIRLLGASEVVIGWEDQAGARGPLVQCRAMLDHLMLDRGVIYDVKTIRSAHPRICAKHMVEYGYDIQWAAYSSAVAKLRPELAGRVDFVFLFCEIEPPYGITLARPDGSMRELGQARWERALRIWEPCLRTNVWPGYAKEIISLEAPQWALAQELGTEI
jgi:hypothetical protein